MLQTEQAPKGCGSGAHNTLLVCIFSHVLLEAQVAKEPFNLEGFAIGNGLTNPAIQYGSYADFSFANGLISKNMQSTLNAVRPSHLPTASTCLA